MDVLFFDTESSDLAASWGRIMCCSFASLSGEVYTFRYDRAKYKGEDLIDDSKLCVAIRDEIEKADMIVGWNSILHDIPLLNARLALAGERSTLTGERHGVSHCDLMWYAGGQSMKIGGRRLDTVAKFFNCENQKTALDGQTWQRAAVGDKKSLDLVVEHCEADVEVLRDVWPHLVPNVKKFQFNLGEVWQFVDQIPSRRTS